jgi:hypothetical protein
MNDAKYMGMDASGNDLGGGSGFERKSSDGSPCITRPFASDTATGSVRWTQLDSSANIPVSAEKNTATTVRHDCQRHIVQRS